MKKVPLNRRTPLKSGGNLKRTRIKPVSDKRKRELAKYSRRKKAYFEKLAESQGRAGQPPWCEAFGPPLVAVDWHHVLPLGRGGKLNQDESLMMAVSREAHNWIGRYPKQAEEKGWLVNESPTS